ncbi:glycosyltransferase family 39 protein [Flavisolibacter nicotianae]|uniref:glycosyltransferase family 39 protein n=1 Tax=Flavisolibacter nicotianae TaxID=2364882 RepID=UPI000EAC6421|nr:glycosyltransferase family 39 protein [Flavisolibacter nicotianae]
MQKKILILLGILLLKIVLHYLLIHPAYELHRDEYLHLDQGRHLAWGYISVPPVTSWFSFLLRLLGNGVFWIKFVPALFGALTILVAWKIVLELKGGLFACVLCSFALLFCILLRINILYQPSSFDVFFWTLTYYTLIRYINTKRTRWLYATCLSLAFGFLSKYNILFLAAGLFPALLLSEHRRIFTNKHFYVSLLIGLLVVSPNLVWQYQNHFPTLAQLRELSERQLVHVNRFNFLKEQVLFFLSGIFVLLAGLAGFLLYRPFRPYRFVLVSFAITLALFLFFQAKSYYSVGLYPVLLSFGAVYLERLFSAKGRTFLRSVSLLLLLALSVPFVLLAFPIHPPAYYASHQQPYKNMGALRWEDGQDHQLPQDYADMTGWKELAQKTDSIYRLLPDRDATLVLCDNYGQAGAINYYSAFKNIRAVSFNADYVNWMPLEKPIQNVILVKEVDDEDSSRQKEQPLFQRILQTGSIENPYAREKGTKIFLLEGAKIDVNERLRMEIQSRKR